MNQKYLVEGFAMQTFLEAPVTGVVNITWLGGDGMIAAIICGLLVGWIYSSIMKAGWTIKLPKQVPPAVTTVKMIKPIVIPEPVKLMKLL